MDDPNQQSPQFPAGGNATGPTILGIPNVETLLKLSNQQLGQMNQILATKLQAQVPTLSALSIINSPAGGTTVSLNNVNGYLMAVAVTTPSTGPNGKIYDANSPANVSTANIMALIPSSGSVVYVYPYVNGLTIQPSTSAGHTVSVYYI